MKYKLLPLLMLFLSGITSVNAQQKIKMSLHDAVAMAIEKSDEAGLANAKAETKNYELESVKNNRYPDVKISGQYMRLANAKITQADNSSTSGTTTTTTTEKKDPPQVNQLILGQASLNMPLFSGFKLKNSIAASENLYQSEIANAKYTKEEIAMKVVEFYGDLYKAQRSVELFTENLKSGQQRVSDFKALEQNGLIARNDFLKSQLQVSKIQLSLDDAEKNVKLLNYSLVTLLKLAPETVIVVSPDDIDPNLFNNIPKPEAEALESRKDLQAVRLVGKASEANIKIAKANYYPSLALSSGYIGLDLQNVVRVENAVNVGVGLSYNLSSIFKNGKEVKAAKSKALEAQKQEAMLTDYIKTQIVKAKEEYELALKQQKVYTEAVEQAAENYRIVRDKYDNGLSDTNDLLEADVEQLGSKINLAYTKANVALKYYEWLSTSGQVLESFNLTQN